MIRVLQLMRLIKINTVLIRYGLNRPVIGKYSAWLRGLSYLNPWSFTHKVQSRGESIRLLFEELGPIFVKFGQVLSTRRDLLSDDIVEELARLQDRVPPFSSQQALAIIEAAYDKSISECFARFELQPLASASIAQVHAATLHDGSHVIVKVLRPNIARIIQGDIALMYLGAKLAKRFWRHGHRLKPVEIVAEFERTIYHELDLLREAANASQLRRNFTYSNKLYVPKIYWDYARGNVMVMERIYGVRISDMATLKAARTDLKKLAEYGVEIFFTQVLRDSFFHADMHPGNLFIDMQDPANPKYIGIDFGIMGSLSPSDQRYIAENLLAFFKRDYRQVAILHIESGWIPADTRIDQFESDIRTVCEPIFEKPLKDISFGQLLLRLFQTAERFDMQIQPQLLLLQKTLLSIEGLGRQLYPELDLWQTAKPFLERWVRKQHGLRRLARNTFKDLPDTLESIIQSPQLAYHVLHEISRQQRGRRHTVTTQATILSSRSYKRSFMLGAGFALTLVVVINVLIKSVFAMQSFGWQWSILRLGALLVIIAWALPKNGA